MNDLRYGMDPDDFDDALNMFEHQLAKRSADESPDVVEQAIARVDKRYDGLFREAYAEYTKSELNRVYDIEQTRLVKDDGARPRWYDGPRAIKGEWPMYKRVLEARIPAAVDSVDDASDSILSECANPRQAGDKRKGLVLGYVQSGKTANYAALIAKAVDTGYRIVIVLSGMHTNLRRQTQSRLDSDLTVNRMGANSGSSGTYWWSLTDPTADIGPNSNISGLGNNSNVLLAVVKKNSTRLQHVANLLSTIDEHTLARKPVLIIDDESDQATPNTKSAKDEVSAINKHVRAIWSEVVTGTYVAYTATPFANIFIDPHDDDDLYPSDFIYALDEPDGYLGASRFFDLDQDANSDDDVAADVMVNAVPEEDARVLVPRGRDLTRYDPEIVPSLSDAVDWFLLATALRRLRDQRVAHSSMLVHTSHRVIAHNALADQLKSHIQSIASEPEAIEGRLRDALVRELSKPDLLDSREPTPEWTEVWNKIQEVISSTKVVVDNGMSATRLSYPDDEPQTVIVVGGGTLSRGLTLEGLISSYFLRTSNAYDTLLQMGRWFGYRPGYGDLVRVWVGPGLIEDFMHLARVEAELRDEIAVMQSEHKTPSEFAPKVRAHSGRLKITAGNKMVAANLVSTGLGGTRKQTIYLDRNPINVKQSHEAVRRLVDSAVELGVEPIQKNGSSMLADVLLPGLSGGQILQFLSEYWISPTEPWLQHDRMRDWISKYAQQTKWNVVLITGGQRHRSVDFGHGLSVHPVNRAPLAQWSPSSLGVDELPENADLVNIRALMSGSDYIADLSAAADAGLLPSDFVSKHGSPSVSLMKSLRRELADGNGLLTIYVIDRDSKPQTDRRNKTRTWLQAEADPIGIGLVFPIVDDEDPGNFFAVDLNEITEDEPDLPMDSEGDYQRVDS